jgi:hypothetical protein
MDKTHIPSQSMLRSMSIVKLMNDTFESRFIRASLVVVDDVADMFYLRHILQMLDYPVEVLTTYNAGRVLNRFVVGYLRVLITSKAMLMEFDGILKFISNAFDIVFTHVDILKQSQIPRSLSHTEVMTHQLRAS